MHLVIAGADSPSAIDDEAAVTPPFAASVLEPERAYMNPKPGRGGSLPHFSQHAVIRIWSQSSPRAPAIAVNLVSPFRRAVHIRAASLCSVDRMHPRMPREQRLHPPHHPTRRPLRTEK